MMALVLLIRFLLLCVAAMGLVTAIYDGAAAERIMLMVVSLFAIAWLNHTSAGANK